MNIDRAAKQFAKGILSNDKLTNSVLEQGGLKPKGDITRDGRYPIGNNESREGFTVKFNTKKWNFFQNTVKGWILESIFIAKEWMIHKYDKDINVYSDERMLRLDKMLKDYINLNFRETPYKVRFMTAIVDIAMGIAKEDIYYRTRLFDFINQLVKHEMFVLTPAEIFDRDWIRDDKYMCDVCHVEHTGVAPVAMRDGNTFFRACRRHDTKPTAK